VSAPEVRVTRTFGACAVLGSLVRETAQGFTYRTPEGGTKSVRKVVKPRHAGMGATVAHAAPCGSCPELRDPAACMHGRVGDCETCMCM
jgi:hypothetical protein